VSSTHALGGMLSRRSDIPSMGDWVGWVGATSCFGLEILLAFTVLSNLGTGVCLDLLLFWALTSQSCPLNGWLPQPSELVLLLVQEWEWSQFG
jgi:hypothetical protein